MTKCDLETNKKKTVMVSGNFNIIHPGHLRLLNFAASCGAYLTVVLYYNNTKTFVDFSLRKDSLQSLSMVDQVIGVDKEHLEELIMSMKPEVIVKGKEHQNVENVENKILSSYGGKLLFASGEIRFSSSDLLHKEFIKESDLSLKIPVEFIQKYKITKEKIITNLEKLSSLKVLIIGDLILDEYIKCSALGMSQEDPTIVVAPISSQSYLGGAGIVAGHVARIGAKAKLLSAIGLDYDGRTIKNYLEKYDIEPFVFEDEYRPTNKKQRFRAEEKTFSG